MASAMGAPGTPQRPLADGTPRGEDEYFRTDTVRVDNVTDRELEADVGRLFVRCGKIRSVTLPLDAAHKPRGHAIVRFEFWQAADKAMRLRPTQLGGKHVSRIRRDPNPYITRHISAAMTSPGDAPLETLAQEASKAGESGGASVRSLDARSVLQPRSTGGRSVGSGHPVRAAAPDAPPAAAAPYVVPFELKTHSSAGTDATAAGARRDATSTGPYSEVVLSDKTKAGAAFPSDTAQPRELASSEKANRQPASPQQGKCGQVSCCAIQ